MSGHRMSSAPSSSRTPSPSPNPQRQQLCLPLVNAPYVDAGATATDSNDGDIEVYTDLNPIPGRLQVDIHDWGWSGWFFSFETARNLLVKPPPDPGFSPTGSSMPG